MTAVSRAALDAVALRAELDPSFVTSLDVVTDTASTNADLIRAASAGAPAGAVLVAEMQHAGRGRFDRTWISPPRAGLTFSLLVRPAAVRAEALGWLPMLSGLALCAAVRSLVADPGAVALKWPNDLLVRGAKAAGILAEAAGGAVVVGMGVNVSHGAAELPGPQATSIELAFPGAAVDRAALLVAVLREFQTRYLGWLAAGGASSDLRAEYRQTCSTIGVDVAVDSLSNRYTGRAVDVDEKGHLLVDTGAGVRPVSAADIAHVHRLP